MNISTWARYQNGILKPVDPLPLEENQHVRIIVLMQPKEAGEVDEARLAEMHRRTDEWLAQQPPDAIQPAPSLSTEEQHAFEAEFDEILRKIRAPNVAFSEEEVMADVAAALAEVRAEQAK